MFFNREVDPDFAGLDPLLRRSLSLSIIEGSFATIMGTVIGGAFLTGYALILGANDLLVGLLASLPLLANLLQIAGSYIIARVGSSKRVCILYLILHRVFWLLIILMPFFAFRPAFYNFRLWLFFILLTLASFTASITSISWMSWMADLVPRRIRGRFFARRNIVSQIVGLSVSLAAGWFIDFWKSNHQASLAEQSYGFSILFAVGTISGLICVILLKKTTGPVVKKKPFNNFIKKLKEPLSDNGFRNFIIFSSIWGFAVGIVGPFFSVYMIKTLNLPFILITTFGVVAGITGIIGMKQWGVFIDRFGPRPLLFICSAGAALIPFLWIFASPENYSILWVINIISGFFWSGIGLASSTLMMNLAPAGKNSVYFAVFSALTGIAGALAPVIGGLLGLYFNGRSLELGFIQLSDLELLFITSFLLRALSISLITMIKIKDNATVRELMASFHLWQRLLPIYNLHHLAITSFNYRANITVLMTRSLINMGSRLETFLSWRRKEGRKNKDRGYNKSNES